MLATVILISEIIISKIRTKITTGVEKINGLIRYLSQQLIILKKNWYSSMKINKRTKITIIMSTYWERYLYFDFRVNKTF